MKRMFVYHLMLATAKLLSLDDRHQQLSHREDILKHAIQISRSILRQADRQANNSDVQGCFTGDAAPPQRPHV